MRVEKYIQCPVHGSIGLTELESEVLKTSAFQRLRGVKQLGLAHYVYPTADYSRLSHSLGVLHSMNKVLKALKASLSISEEHEKYYRMAAMLHDIGHYPLSHCTETEVVDYYKDKSADKLLLEKKDNEATTSKEDSGLVKLKGLNHEALGGKVIEQSPELKTLLTQRGLEPEKVAKIFKREAVSEFPLTKLVSSDLDVDRFDYLLRTAVCTGLPFGRVDSDYIINCLTVDIDGEICVLEKGMRAAEHFLMGRYFDYQKVANHKAVVGFEQVASKLIALLLEEAKLTLDERHMSAMIKEESQDPMWRSFDDGYLFEKIRTSAQESGAQGRGAQKLQILARCVLDRVPPKLIYQDDRFSTNAQSQGNVDHNYLYRRREEDVLAIARECGLEDWQLFVWTRKRKPLRLTTLGSTMPIGNSGSGGSKISMDEELSKTIRIVDREGGSSEYIFERDDSFLRALSGSQHEYFRVYFIPTDTQGTLCETLKDKISTRLKNS